MKRGSLGAFVVFVVLASAGCSRSSSSTTGTSGSVTVDIPDASSLVPDLLSGLNLNSATGHVESTGATGTWTLDTGTCYSGDDDGFFGVFVKSKADKRVWVKLVKDPTKGWTVGASIPDSCKAGANGETCDVKYFDQHACTTLDASGLQSYAFKGKNAAGKHQFDGNVSFDCTADKAHVSGKLKIEKCSP